MQHHQAREDVIDGGHAGSTCVRYASRANDIGSPLGMGMTMKLLVNASYALTGTGVGTGRLSAVASSGATSTCGTGALVKSRHRLASVARNWWRCTTMSTMPCSLRYSAR